MKPKHYTQDEIFNGTRIGCEFEFYSKLKPEKVSIMLSERLKKKIVIPKTLPELDKNKVLIYHSDVSVTDKIFKLEADYSGGFDMFELITGPLDYTEARKIIISVLDWIELYGYTNNRCSIHLNISFKPILKTTIEIKDLNVLKFILNFDEKRVYDLFPVREDSVYAKSIKKDLSNKIFFQNFIPADFNLTGMLNVPDEKYYGINFLKREKNYLEFRYLGGKDYQNKVPKILDMLDFFAQSLFYNINHPEYTQEETNKIKNLYVKFREELESINDYRKFKEKFKDIKISIDLSKNEQHIISYWETLKYRIFDLVSRCNLRKGNINYDTDIGRMQLFECNLKYANLEELDLVKCNIGNSQVTKCDLFYNEINNCMVTECQAIRENEFVNCKIKQSNIYGTNVSTDCFIENYNEMINGKFIRGVIRKGVPGTLAKLEDTIIVEDQIKKNTTKKETIVKDWRWIKSLKNNLEK